MGADHRSRRSYAELAGDFSNPQSPAIICSNASAYVLRDVAYVLCHEHVKQTALAATNVFVREGGGWRMVHHQAGPSPPVDPSATREPMQ